MKKIKYKKKAKQGKSHQSKLGKSPGSLIFTGEASEGLPVLTLLSYDPEEMIEVQSEDLDKILLQVNMERVNWVNLDGLHNTEWIEKLGKFFDLHPLLLEDTLNVDSMTKSEILDEYDFLSMKMLSIDKAGSIQKEQVSFILGPHYLISFQERVGDVFDPVRERLKSAIGRLRNRKSDYLLCALADVIVDNYYLVADAVGDQVEEMEINLLSDFEEIELTDIVELRKAISLLIREMYPLRDSFRRLYGEDEDSQIEARNLPFYRDVFDHIEHILQQLEGLRDSTGQFMDLHMNRLNTRMNNVMKTLTVVASIFIPLTFLVGVYGMNFEYMPELHYKWAYPILWLVFITLGTSLFLFMKRNRWL